MKVKKEWMAPKLIVHGKVEEITMAIPAPGSGFAKLQGKGDDTNADQMGLFSCCC